MVNLVKRLMTDESGVSATEYAVLLAFVGAAVVVAAGTFGDGLNSVFAALVAKMGTWVT